MASTSQNKNASFVSKSQYKARILLALCVSGETTKGKLRERVKADPKAISDFDEVLDSLEKAGSISTTKKGSSRKVSLIENGWQGLLGSEMENLEFAGTVVGTWVAKGLLAYLKSAPTAPSAIKYTPKIASYDEFKTLALETYDQINFEFNHNNFVPIYKIRRSIGELVTRTEFNEWMIKLQAEDILLLQESGVEDSAPDKLQDSVSTPISGLRCYATKKTK